MHLTTVREQLKQGKLVKFRPKGNSMSGKIESGQLCTVAPVYDIEELFKGAIVLCTVKGKIYLHLIKSVKGQHFKIGNNRGHDNGWTKFDNIHGILIKVE